MYNGIFTRTNQINFTRCCNKPSLKTVAAVALIATPVGLAGTLAVGNKDAIKSTLHTVGTEVKTDALVVGSTVKKGGEIAIKGVKKGAKAVTSEFNNMLYFGGAALVGLVVLKMTVFK